MLKMSPNLARTSGLVNFFNKLLNFTNTAQHLAPPKSTNPAPTAHRNIVERSNQNSIVHLIETYKSPTDTPAG